MHHLSYLLIIFVFASQILAERKPNILWITSEDNGPHLGCYGDSFATTPHLDALAKRGMIYRNAWSNAPVCAPARTTIISGIYPPSTGSEHMRSETRLPSGFKMYPQLLREAGYYCTNNSKKDYNLLETGRLWDESSKTAHWKNRGEDQPFFAIFNITVSHESQIRKRPHKAVHDPSKVPVPSYHPDIPEVRRDWAQYYDKVSEMDDRAGMILAELEADDLAEDTIIFYFADHGSGMPRSKRCPYQSGLHVPLIVSVPERFKHLSPDEYQVGGGSDRLVSFIDLAPTLMSIIGKKPEPYFQGSAFMGIEKMPEPKYAYGFRGRMDERLDMIRSIRDRDFIYIRHFMPHKPYGQFIEYMFKTPTTIHWHKLHQKGKLTPVQSMFWKRKPVEELYDLRNDHDEIHNLAQSKDHQKTLARFRKQLRNFQFEIRDLGFLPEEEIHSRSVESSPYEVGHDDDKYPLTAIFKTAMTASRRGKKGVQTLRKALTHSDPAVRYWAAMGYVNRGKDATKADAPLLKKALKDPSASVRVIAAEALAKHGGKDDLHSALEVLIAESDLVKQNVWVAMLALNAIDELDEKAAPLLSRIKSIPQKSEKVPARYRSYVPDLIAKIISDFSSSSSFSDSSNSSNSSKD